MHIFTVSIILLTKSTFTSQTNKENENINFLRYGEPVNINLIRDKDSGKSKGFCFLCYEDQRSTNLAVDNLNGIKILGRSIRVDHVENYKPPKGNKGNFLGRDFMKIK